MKTVGQRNPKLLGGQGKTDGLLDGQADSSMLCRGINRKILTIASFQMATTM
jgi:hypothetical protein